MGINVKQLAQCLPLIGKSGICPYWQLDGSEYSIFDTAFVWVKYGLEKKIWIISSFIYFLNHYEQVINPPKPWFSYLKNGDTVHTAL